LEKIEESIKLSKKESILITRATSERAFGVRQLNLKIKKGEFVVFLGE